MCNQSELVSKVKELQEWQALLDEAETVVKTLKDFLKQEMNERGVEELEAGTNICRYAVVLSNRFDTTSFKREHADLYKAVTKQVTTRRFSVS